MQDVSSSSFDIPTTGRANSKWTPLLLLSPALLLILTLFGGGLLLGLWQALGYQPGQHLFSIDLEHFYNVFHDPDFTTSLRLTLYISLVSTCVSAAISIILALSLIRWASRSATLSFILQIPLAAPHLVIAIAMLLLLSPSGLISRLCTTLGIISSSSSFPLLTNDEFGISILSVYIWKEVPFITFMLLTVLKNMGSELLEAGATLGGSALQRFYHITLPVILPSLTAASLIVFAFTFGSFEVPFLLGRTYPTVLPVWAYKNYSDVDLLARPEGIAIGVIIAVIITLSILLSQVLLQVGKPRNTNR